ncbi:MAG: aminoacyl-tRNA hydrolase [Gemmatimonadetes bacterium]|nr:aminoacyl-tRNA hydrolase [Gemmatimonadota bacterium]
MSTEGLLVVDDCVAIPRAELHYRATRSGGPGGQHVNTASTRVELEWDVGASVALTEEQRARLREKLANRIDQNGVLHLAASTHRSQYQNKEEVTNRLRILVAEALRVPKKRKKTRPPAAAREARLRAKRRRADTKKLRGRVAPED